MAFGQVEVRLDADDPDVLEVLRNDYRHMLGRGETPPALSIGIHRVDGGWIGEDSTGERTELDTARGVVRWARQRVLEHLILAHPGLLWLHGGAVGHEGRALLVIGRRGMGKSTLVAALCGRGASYLSDDIIPLEPATMRVHPFARAPELRPDPGAPMPPGWLFEVKKRPIAVGDRLAVGPMPVQAVLLPEVARGAPVAVHRCSRAAAAVAIAEGLWNFEAHGAQAAAVLSRLVSAAPVLRVSFDPGEAPRAAEAAVAWLGDASGTSP